MSFTVWWFVLGGCGDVKDRELPPDVRSWPGNEDVKDVVEDLGAPERDALERYRLRYAPGGTLEKVPPPGHLTVGEALDEQARWDAGRASLKAEEDAAAAELAAKRASMAAMCDLHVTSLTYLPQDAHSDRTANQLELKFTLTNHGDKEIRAVEGELVFALAGGRQLRSETLIYNGDLRAAHSEEVVKLLDDDPSSASDRELAVRSLGELVLTWQPRVVVFTDETSLRLGPP